MVFSIMKFMLISKLVMENIQMMLIVQKQQQKIRKIQTILTKIIQMQKIQISQQVKVKTTLILRKIKIKCQKALLKKILIVTQTMTLTLMLEKLLKLMMILMQVKIHQKKILHYQRLKKVLLNIILILSGQLKVIILLIQLKLIKRDQRTIVICYQLVHIMFKKQKPQMDMFYLIRYIK